MNLLDFGASGGNSHSVSWTNSLEANKSAFILSMLTFVRKKLISLERSKFYSDISHRLSIFF